MKSFSYIILCTLISQINITAQWYSQTSITNNHLVSVNFINQNIGFTVGFNGTILKTTNGGATWIYQASGTDIILTSVNFIDSTTGWVVGWNGIILKTTDAGINWTNQTSGTSYNLHSIFFVDNNVGWTVGQNGIILKTTNGGVEWLQQTIESGALLAVYFNDYNNGWAVGYREIPGIGYYAIILRTTNGGTTWIPYQLNNTKISSVHFVDQNTGWVAGESKILKTTDRGISWIPQLNPAPYHLYSVYFIDQNIGWIVGGYGTILKTTNGGTIWVPQISETTNILYSIYFANSNIGWVVGESGIILKTTNGGILPVELSLFTADVSGNNINLKWSTASELNNQGFEIERSTDKNDWLKIGFKEGKGTTTEQQNYSFTDDVNGIIVPKLYYRLKQIDFDGSYEYSDVVDVAITPIKFSLFQNYPNPFNPNTKISWQSPVGSHQTLKVYDVLGREVATLVNEYKDAGSYEVEFDGSQLASGVYYYRLKVGEFIQTKKMTVLK